VRDRLWFSIAMNPGVPRSPRRSPDTASAEGRRRFARLARYMLVFTPLLLVLNFLPIESEPWAWIKVAVIGVGSTILLVWGARLTLWQRDEYWRKGGAIPNTRNAFRKTGSIDRLPSHPQPPTPPPPGSAFRSAP